MSHHLGTYLLGPHLSPQRAEVYLQLSGQQVLSSLVPESPFRGDVLGRADIRPTCSVTLMALVSETLDGGRREN